ncbi:ATP-binding protein [Streptomyces sp. NPDC090445]|uniref:ATP-binding protein n=1 Tax=Streptomyces sp. NPDC090445 TaxID=3365963 RepID=UPI0038149971
MALPERASVIVTSNKPFGRWGEVFGDETAAATDADDRHHHVPEQEVDHSATRRTG